MSRFFENKRHLEKIKATLNLSHFKFPVSYAKVWTIRLLTDIPLEHVGGCFCLYINTPISKSEKSMVRHAL